MLMKFKAEHYKQIQHQENLELGISEYISDTQLEIVETLEHNYTILANGRIVACAGIIPAGGLRGDCWAAIDKSIGRNLLVLHRHTLAVIEAAPFERLQGIVQCEFEEGHRWMKMLGFQMEAERMSKYAPDGSDCSLYAKVR